MASFNPTIITTKGHALMAKIVAGTATPQFHKDFCFRLSICRGNRL